MNTPEKPHSPACDRNREPILEVLRHYLVDRRQLLEIGSGTGQHAAYLAGEFPMLRWQCSDLRENLPGIRLWLKEAGHPNTPAPIALDVTSHWPSTHHDVIFTANTLHIMSWPDVEQMFSRLPTVMGDDALLIVYGPFNYNGRFTSDSNARFDEWLKARAAHQGIRDIERVDALAQRAGMHRLADHPMPANNRTVVWQRHGGDGNRA